MRRSPYERRAGTFFPGLGEGLGEEVRRRLSGHGFSPKERRAKEEFEASFLAGEASGLTNPSPSQALTFFTN